MIGATPPCHAFCLLKTIRDSQLISSWPGRHDIEVAGDPGRSGTRQGGGRAAGPGAARHHAAGAGRPLLCRDLRPRFQGPIVMLTSLDSDMNQILSLELGANDYILKTTPPPCCWPGCGSSSASRDRLPTRGFESPPQRLQFGCLRIDGPGRDVRLDGESIPSPPPILTSCGSCPATPARSWAGGAVSQPAGRDYDGQDRGMDVAISRPRRRLGMTATTRPGSRRYARRAICWCPRPGNKPAE